MEQHLAYINCLNKYDGLNLQSEVMKTILNRAVLLLALTVGSIVGIFRGNEAKQKWIFKIRSNFEEKRHLAEQRKVLREGGVALDDIEIAAFHNN